VAVAVGLTVVATLLFQPARRRLEALADRFVFGRRDSALEALQTFGAAMGETSRSSDVGEELAHVVFRVLSVEAVTVEISDFETATAGEWNVGHETRVPIVWGDETYGTVRCLSRRGEELGAADVGLVQALAGQAALTLSHARLASRMVTAQDAERRRIERNIHDGVQQDLATQIGQLALARVRANGDAELNASLSRIQEEMQRTLSEIRDLAQGIHPSVLRDGGLAAAIEDRCGRLAIEAVVDIAPDLRTRRFAADTEAAAYFTVSEAIANVVKHARASSVTVEVFEEGGLLCVGVADDGAGFGSEGIGEGSGLAGLSDRLRALGGEVWIESRPGMGTSIRARLPMREARTGR
jgi:signal transduction histidine kinase